MAEGIRIRHHTRRNQLLPVPLLHKPFPTPHRCHKCDTSHPCKVLHLDLDTNGAVIVSKDIWADLQRTTNSGGFRVANLVAKPPTQTIRPPLRKLKLEGVDLGAGLVTKGLKRSETYTTSRRRSSTRDILPEVRTVTVDDYVDVAAKCGIDWVTAVNVLVAKVLAEGSAVTGK